MAENIKGWHVVRGATLAELKKEEAEAMRRYGDIIDLPAPESAKHPRQPMSVRAAQFSPFAALTGFEDAVEETARLTDEKPELDEDARQKLDEKLNILKNLLYNGRSRGNAPDDPAVISFSVFVPDARKEGGAFETVRGEVKKLDEVRRVICLKDGTAIQIDHILDMNGSIFD